MPLLKFVEDEENRQEFFDKAFYELDEYSLEYYRLLINRTGSNA